MVKKKNEDKKEKPSQKKTMKSEIVTEDTIKIEKFSISELLAKNSIKPLNAVGFLNYYGLEDDFRKEFESGKKLTEFSEGEFEDMYKRYIEREI